MKLHISELSGQALDHAIDEALRVEGDRTGRSMRRPGQSAPEALVLDLIATDKMEVGPVHGSTVLCYAIPRWHRTHGYFYGATVKEAVLRCALARRVAPDAPLGRAWTALVEVPDELNEVIQ